MKQLQLQLTRLLQKRRGLLQWRREQLLERVLGPSK